MAKQNSQLTNLYLIAYNTACMLGWFYLWVLQYKYYTAVEPMEFWPLIETTLKFSQTAAIMEIVHAMFGIVRSPVMTTFLQVFSRIMLLWGYANPCPDAQQAWGIKLMVLSWSLVEVPRYLFYIVKLLNLPMPTWLLFLRYNLFIVLYPTGISGELLTIFNSLSFIKKTGLFSVSLPNAWNIAINYYGISIFMLLIYIPLGPMMIQNMFVQRKKNWINARKEKSA